MKPDLDAIRARCDSTLRAEYIDVRSTAHGYRRRACHFARTDIPALLAYIDELEGRTTYTVGETEWAHRIAVAEQRFADEYDARKAAEREIAELKARITTLEAMKP
jgi:hypothetical protein